AASFQFSEHAREIVVGAFQRGDGGFGAWTEIVLREVRLAQPKQRKFGHAVLPKRACQRAGRPLVARGVRLGGFRIRSEGLNQLGRCVRGERFVGEENFSEAVTLVPLFAIVEQSDRFGAGNGGAVTAALQNFGDGGQAA